MKILLLNPTVDFDKQFGTLKKFYTPIPSLALAYIGAVLREADYDVKGVDSFMNCHTSQEMYDIIIKEKPDVLGISLLTPCAPLVDPILPKLREALPNLIIVLGNIHGSAFAEHYVSNQLADYCVHHEGEATMLELMNAVRDGKPVNDIEGITYFNKLENKAVKTPKRKWINNSVLDDMPRPAWDLFPVEQFIPDIRLQGKTKVAADSTVQALPLLASRGCPFNCTFCSPKNSIGQKYRMRTPKNVVDEMEHFYKKWGTTTFYYMDLTFPISEKLGIAFCDELIERNIPVQWACETRVSAVSEPLLKKMKESGCFRIDYGIECGNQKMLDSVNKSFTIAQVREAVRLTNKVGIESEGLFIIGLPDETEQDTWDTINFALSLDLDHIKLNLFVPYPGSDVWDRLKKNDELTNMDFNEYTSYPTYTKGKVPFVPKGRTHEELVHLQKVGMRKAFFRSRVILRELRHFKFDKLDQYWSAVKSLIRPANDTTSDRFEAKV